MSKLYITEYPLFTDKTVFHAAQEPSIAEQAITMQAGSTQSAAFNAKTALVRVVSDADCSIAFGEDPSATVNKKFLPAKSPEYFQVGFGQKVAVIPNP